MKKNSRYLWWGVAIIGAVLVGAWYLLPALLSGRGFTPATGGSIGSGTGSSTGRSSSAPSPSPAPALPPGDTAPAPDPYSVTGYWGGYWDDPERGPVDAALSWLTDTTYYSGDD